MRVRLTEHSWLKRPREISDTAIQSLPGEVIRRYEEELRVFEEALAGNTSVGPTLFRNQTRAFHLEKLGGNSYRLEANYLVGADWLVRGKSYVQVIPKLEKGAARAFADCLDEEEFAADAPTSDEKTWLNADYIEAQGITTASQVHYLRMLMTIVKDSHFDKYLEDLFHIDYAAPALPLPSDEDLLTPLLVVRFVQVIRRIVSKGLRKSYYTVQHNLTNRVKGKVLVSQHIKTNVFKSKLSTVLCQYDNFGQNTLENQFLKKVLRFARRYLDTHGKLFGDTLPELHHAVRAVSPAFELIDEMEEIAQLRHTTHHPFYGEYKEAIRVGKLLLKRFAYTINSVDSTDRVMTPPFWINMPSLFEMYVCAMMRAHNPAALDAIEYQFSTHGNQIDILFAGDRTRLVIDTKYKMHYLRGHLHQDIRQVAGYARLRKVRGRLGISYTADDTVDCLIVYPDLDNGVDDFSIATIWDAKREVKAYHRVWKLGVKIPVWNSPG